MCVTLEVGLFGSRSVLLATQDRDELGSGLEEPAALTDGLVGAVELSRSDTATVAEQAMVLVREQPGLLVDGGRDPQPTSTASGGREVLLGDASRSRCVRRRGSCAVSDDPTGPRWPRGSCPG